MAFSTPLAIVLYVMTAFLIATVIMRRLTKKQLISAILKSSSDNRRRITKSYGSLIKIQKILMCVYPSSIAVMILSHFSVEDDDGILLLVSGFLVVLFIVAIEDIQFRKSIISRPKNEPLASQSVNAVLLQRETLRPEYAERSF